VRRVRFLVDGSLSGDCVFLTLGISFLYLAGVSCQLLTALARPYYFHAGPEGSGMVTDPIAFLCLDPISFFILGPVSFFFFPGNPGMESPFSLF